MHRTRCRKYAVHRVGAAHRRTQRHTCQPQYIQLLTAYNPYNFTIHTTSDTLHNRRTQRHTYTPYTHLRTQEDTETHLREVCLCKKQLPHTATTCNTHCNTLEHTAAHCNALQHAATHCDTLQYTVPHCNTLQHTATHCSTLQRTATRCNTLQHRASC